MHVVAEFGARFPEQFQQWYKSSNSVVCLSTEQPGSFPDHANVSADLWKTISDNKQVEELIRTDMLFHTARTKQELETCSTREQLATLAIMSLAELQSNATTLFGGFDSDSYKIKRKRLEKNIKFALELL